MNPDRWSKVESIFHKALEADDSRRAAVLEESCAGDEALRREVESLLAQYENAGGFLETPAFEAEAGTAQVRSLPAAEKHRFNLVGTLVGQFRVLEEIGVGGMGVVYKAEDTKLGRPVALKFLPQDLAVDRVALERFRREAHAASTLNHPNICTIYEVEEHNHQPVIVMELLEGQSLKETIRKGHIATEEFIAFGIQMSEALEAAHAKGIIHRDIKPGNIVVVGDRWVKILDFGLAKAIPAVVADDRAQEASLTLEGVITGTTPYMSPEQARGDETDARSDLFSLGVVLYEMATRQLPFARKNTVSTIDAILNAHPPSPTSLNPALPKEIDRIIDKALKKDRDQRYQHASEVLADLKSLQLEKASATQHPVLPAPIRDITSPVHPRLWALLLCTVSVIVVAILAYQFWPWRAGRYHGTAVLTKKDTVVLADFSNSTCDAVFDGALRQGMAVQLQQSPFLSLISDERIQRTLGLMSQPADARLTPELARQICERTGGAAVLDGSIASLGSQYVLGLRAKNCRTGDVLDDEQAQAARKEDVLQALDQIAKRFRTRVGESLATIQQHDTPLAEAATPSLEALKAYSTGWKITASQGEAAGGPFFKQAIEIDPEFAAAHVALGVMYSTTGESALATESARRAYELRDRASDNERFFITAYYDGRVTGNVEKAEQTCQAWAQAYPRETFPHGFLAGFVYPIQGRYEEAVEEAEKTIKLDGDFALVYDLLSIAFIDLDRLQEAGNVLRIASDRKLENPQFLVHRYDIAFLKGDKAEMDRVVALAQEKSGGDDWIADSEAFALSYSGHLLEARRMSRHAADLAQQSAHRERAALFTIPTGIWEALFGNAPAGKRSVMAALRLAKDREVEYGAAVALALSGESSRSQALANDLEKQYPEDTSVKFSYIPTVRALLALNRGQPSTAIELLQIAGPHELGTPRSSIHGFFGALYPVYVRGNAYLAMHRGVEAAAEFQKILDHRGVVISDPIGALAHLQLGRAYALTGEINKAKSAYQEFLTLWKDADPDIPILKQAQAEFAKLQ